KKLQVESVAGEGDKRPIPGPQTPTSQAGKAARPIDLKESIDRLMQADAAPGFLHATEASVKKNIARVPWPGDDDGYTERQQHRAKRNVRTELFVKRQGGKRRDKGKEIRFGEQTHTQ